MAASMRIRAFVLVLAASLLGAAPACRCEMHVRTKAKKPFCRHCPKESAPREHSSSDCCCVQGSGDRTLEETDVLHERGFATVEPDLNAEKIRTLRESEEVISALADRAAPRRPSLPLFILLRHLTI